MTSQATVRKSSAAPRKIAGGAQALAQYTQAREAAIAAFNANHRIQPLWRELTLATDTLLTQAATAKGVSIIAVGGYGRRELFPFSDVDVLILLPHDAREGMEQQIVTLLQSLWDRQIPVSHATRTLKETVALASRDATICAALMDARHISGERSQYLALKRALKKEVFGSQPRQFIEAKLGERDARHGRFGDSRFMLEPNIKEGKGGLRDLQTLNWLARYCYGVATAQDLVREDLLQANEWRHYREAYLFFASVRAHMHILRGRSDERLSFDLQTQIAQAMGFRGRMPQARAEQLMMRYFQFTREVGNLTRILCAILEEKNMRARAAPHVIDHVTRHLPEYLQLENGRLNFATDADPVAAPHQVMGLFAASQLQSVDIHPRAQLALSRLLPRMGSSLPLDGESNRLFLSMLLSKHQADTILRRMNEMGVLQALIPEFGRISGQMQYDGYHTYTVDEHTLVAIANLHTLEGGVWEEQMPLATSLACDISNRAVLYVAMLCHDIAKGTGGAHADKGSGMAQHVATRLGLSAQEATLVGWLVKHHLLLSDTAFKRDLDDPQTIADFVGMVQSPDRLRLLLLITVADVKAVGPNIWNRWKGSLMRTLYHRAQAAMGIGHSLPQTQEAARALIAQWRADPSRPAVAISHDPFRAVTEIHCCISQQRRLFSALAGAVAWIGATIVSARIRPLLAEEGEGAALAELHIQNLREESLAEDSKRLADLPGLIQQALDGQLPMASELPKRRLVAPYMRDVAIRPGAYFDNDVSATATVIEVNARDRVGLLYDILRVLDEQNLHVVSSHIATYGSMAVDVFYVKDAYGYKILHDNKQAQVQQALLQAVEPK
jgi:[protein-PII] uridylyltransferase